MDELNDQNAERDEVPFPTQSGPPRFLNLQHRPGNGQPVMVEQPPAAQQQASFNPYAPFLPPRPAPQPVAKPAEEFSPLLANLQKIQLAASVGAFTLAEMWAANLVMFRQEYQQRTGQTLSDQQALELVLAPLYMALGD